MPDYLDLLESQSAPAIDQVRSGECSHENGRRVNGHGHYSVVGITVTVIHSAASNALRSELTLQVN